MASKSTGDDDKNNSSIAKQVADWFGQTQTADIFRDVDKAIIAAGNDYLSIRSVCIISYTAKELTEIVKNDVYSLPLHELEIIQANLLILQSRYVDMIDQQQTELDELANKINSLGDKIHQLAVKNRKNVSPQTIEKETTQKQKSVIAEQDKDKKIDKSLQKEKLSFFYALFDIILPVVSSTISEKRIENNSLQ